jgi:hypothetical protein
MSKPKGSTDSLVLSLGGAYLPVQAAPLTPFSRRLAQAYFLSRLRVIAPEAIVDLRKNVARYYNSGFLDRWRFSIEGDSLVLEPRDDKATAGSDPGGAASAQTAPTWPFSIHAQVERPSRRRQAKASPISGRIRPRPCNPSDPTLDRPFADAYSEWLRKYHLFNEELANLIWRAWIEGDPEPEKRRIPTFDHLKAMTDPRRYGFYRREAIRNPDFRLLDLVVTGWNVVTESYSVFRKRVDVELTIYKERVDRMARGKGFVRLSPIRQPEHFDWLVEFQVKGCSYGEVARRYGGKLHGDSLSGIWEGIKSAAQLINLKLRHAPVGRPPKPPSSKGKSPRSPQTAAKREADKLVTRESIGVDRHRRGTRGARP